MSKAKTLEAILFGGGEESQELYRTIQGKLKEARKSLVETLRLTDESLSSIANAMATERPNGTFGIEQDFEGNTWVVFSNGQKVMIEPAGGGDERAAERVEEQAESEPAATGGVVAVVNTPEESPHEPVEVSDQ